MCLFVLHGVAFAQPEPEWEDISNAGTVIYAGTYYPDQGPANAFSSAGTYYSGTSASLPHLGLDLTVPRVLRYVEARGTASFSFIGRIKYSDDGVTFSDTATIVSVAANNGVWHQFAVPDYGAHRYWIIADLQDDAYLQIDELRWFAPPAGTPPPGNLEDVTIAGNFIVGGPFYPGQGGSNAFNAPGAWYSGTSSSGTYVGRDFGVPRELRRIDATGTASFSFYGRVRYSDDGVTYFDTSTTIYLPPNSASSQPTLIPETYGAHRYWVIADLQDDGYLQVDELKLFAVPLSPPPPPEELQDVTSLGTWLSGGGSYAGQGPENAFNAPALWYSGHSSGETHVGRDLVTPRSIRRIDATGTASFSFSGEVKYSDDGATWTSTSTTIDVPASTATPQSYSVEDYGAHRYWAVFDLQDDAYLQIDEIRLFASVPQTVLATPVFSVPGGTYFSDVTVAVTVEGTGATIHYTQNGLDPTASDPTVVSGASILVSYTQVLKARTFRSGTPPSETTVASYAMKVGDPSVSPVAGNYDAPPTVTISPSPGVTWRYTTNGTTPTATSSIYTDPMAVNSPTTFRIVGFKTGWSESDVAVHSYTVDTVVPTITAGRFPSPLNGWHLTPVTVSFTCADNIAIATCSSPTTVSTEGAGQAVTGTAVDSAGRQTVLVETLNLDLTPPVVALSSPAEGLVTTSTTVELTGEVSDVLSGLAAVTCNGVAATVVDDQVSCTVALSPGRNPVVLIARDAAGNNTSAGLMVTRVGTATQLKLTPSIRTMLVGEAAVLSLLDNFGAAVGGATWTSSEETIVSLSADDPPVLTALAEGQSNIFVTKNGFTKVSTILVNAGLTLEDGSTRLEDGTTRWRTPSTPVSNWKRDRPIYAHRVDASGPDVFTVDTNVVTRERTVRAISSSGEEQWLMVVKAEPLMGDAYGGLIVGVEPSSNYCRAVFSEFEFCYTAFTRVPGSAGTSAWRYDSAGWVDRPAQGPDGTIYAIEHFAAPGTIVKSVVILDGATGQVTARVPLRNFASQEPATVGPIVGGDGLGYILVTNPDLGLTLLRLSREGEGATEVIEPRCTGQCDQARPKQLVPDGIGGLLLLTQRYIPPTWYLETRLTRLDGLGGKVDTVVPYDTHIDMVGQAGIAYLRTASGTQATDVPTMTPIWSAAPGWNLVAAKPDGGAAAQNEAGELGHFSNIGALTGPLPLGLEDPAPEFESLVGMTSGGLTAKAASLANATRFTSTFKKVGVGFWEPQWHGSPKSNLQMFKPGIGLFAKGHNIFGYHHTSLRIVPRNQDWVTNRPGDFVNRDQYKNLFATIGAGPVPSGCSGPMVSEINRGNDVTKPHTSLEGLLYPPIMEDALIERLFALDAHYPDNLTYECLPDEGTNEFNSNSYIGGLLDAADIPRPGFPTRYSWLYPGWTKPVPPNYFVPQ